MNKKKTGQVLTAAAMAGLLAGAVGMSLPSYADHHEDKTEESSKDKKTDKDHDEHKAKSKASDHKCKGKDDGEHAKSKNAEEKCENCG